MISRLILLLSCVILPGIGNSQEFSSPEEEWHFIENQVKSNLCRSDDLFGAITGFMQYLSYNEKIILWEEYEYEILEYVIFVHLSPDFGVDSLKVEVVGLNKDKRPLWLKSLTNGLQEKISKWPKCNIPVAFSDESWTVVLPYSYFSMSMSREESHNRTSTQKLKKIISSYAKNNLSVVFPIRVSGWGVVH